MLTHEETHTIKHIKKWERKIKNKPQLDISFSLSSLVAHGTQKQNFLREKNNIYKYIQW